MPVIITENRCKRTRYVNGTIGNVAFYNGLTYFITSGDVVIPVFPVYNCDVAYYPLRLAYATTVHKIQDQMLDHVTLVFNKENLTPGIGYVVVSRVSSADRVGPMFHLTRRHFSSVQ